MIIFGSWNVQICSYILMPKLPFQCAGNFDLDVRLP
jgi:hypothetical protein